MPSFSEVIKLEKEKPAGTIRLIRCGEFYRAYGRSAWYYVSIYNNYKVVRKFIKAINDDIYYIGFPCTAFSDNTQGAESKSMPFGVDVKVSDEMMAKLTDEDYEKWKTTVETVPSSRADMHALPLMGADAEREVIRRIRDFNLESHTPIECMTMVAACRTLLAGEKR